MLLVISNSSPAIFMHWFNLISVRWPEQKTNKQKETNKTTARRREYISYNYYSLMHIFYFKVKFEFVFRGVLGLALVS